METNASRRSVFIVEDSRLMRERLVALLSETDGVAVVGEAVTPRDAIEGILRTRPDWVLLDIQLTGGTGIEVLAEVRSQVPATEFIVLTNMGSGYRRACADAGAGHFLDKTRTSDILRIIAGAGPTPTQQGSAT